MKGFARILIKDRYDDRDCIVVEIATKWVLYEGYLWTWNVKNAYSVILPFRYSVFCVLQGLGYTYQEKPTSASIIACKSLY